MKKIKLKWAFLLCILSVGATSQAATWHHPKDKLNDAITIQYNSGLDQQLLLSPKVVLGSHSEGVIAWIERRQWNDLNDREAVYVSEGVIGPNPWVKNNQSLSFLNSNAYNVDIAMSQANTAYVVWDQDVGEFSGNHAIYMASRNSSGVWQKPVNINDTVSSAVGLNRKPKVAVSPDGDLVVVLWLQEMPNGQEVVVKREYSPVTGWLPSTVMNILVSKTYDFFVSIGNGGNAVIAWDEIICCQLGGAKVYLFESIRSPAGGGAWTAPVGVVSDIAVPSGLSYSTLQDVQMNRAGDYVISYTKHGFEFMNGQMSKLFYHARIAGVPFKSKDFNDSLSNSTESKYVIQNVAKIDDQGRVRFLFVDAPKENIKKQRLFYSEYFSGQWPVPAPADKNSTFYNEYKPEMNYVYQMSLSQNQLGMAPGTDLAVAAYAVEYGSEVTGKYLNGGDYRVIFRDYQNGVWSGQKEIPPLNPGFNDNFYTWVQAKVSEENSGVIIWVERYYGVGEHSHAIYMSQYY